MTVYLHGTFATWLVAVVRGPSLAVDAVTDDSTDAVQAMVTTLEMATLRRIGVMTDNEARPEGQDEIVAVERLRL